MERSSLTNITLKTMTLVRAATAPVPIKRTKLDLFFPSELSCKIAAASPALKRKRLDLMEPSEVSQTSLPPEDCNGAFLSPSSYLSFALKNKGMKSRVDPVSLEHLLYFEPYQESSISAEILRALRQSDISELQRFDSEELLERNQFGESLVHLACRLGISENVTAFLINEVKLPLNVRDRFGRTPLHNACLAAWPNFENIKLILDAAPKLVLFEDDKGKLPFDYIPKRNYGKWVRFLSEGCVLKRLQDKFSVAENNSTCGDSKPHALPAILGP